MAYLPDGVADLLRGSVRLGVFFRMSSDPPLHLWMGLHDIEAGIVASGAIDGETAVYTGAGRLLDLPDLEVLINGLADQVTFAISVEEAVYARFLSGLDAAPPEVRGARVVVGIAPLDARWHPLTDIIPLWTGTGDFWGVEHEPPEDPTRSALRKISLTIGTGDTSRAQPRQLSFTDASQKRTSPTDRFFERVARYVQQYIVSWPRF